MHKPFLTCPGEAEQILGALKYHGGVYHLMASSGRSSWKKYHEGVYHLKALLVDPLGTQDLALGGNAVEFS